MAPKRKLSGEKVDPSTSRRRRQLMDDLVRETDDEFNRLMDEHGEIPPSHWPHHGIEITPEEEAALGIPGEQYVEEADNDFYTTSDSHSRPHDQRPVEDDVHIWPEGFECMENLDLKACLAYWAVVLEENRLSVSVILAIMRNKLGIKLPMDRRSLVKTPSNVGSQIVAVSGGQFWYQGVGTALKKYFRDVVPYTSHFSMQVFVDGLPLHKSGQNQLWPILVKIEELPDAPVMVAGVFCGQTKPQHVEDFLRPFVNEMNELRQVGVNINDKICTISVKLLIADSPARAFAKAIVGFNHRHGCTKCTCVGEYSREHHKVIFSDVGAAPRTDADFRARSCLEHHKEFRSPLEDLDNFNIIEDVVVGDRLHLVDLGVTRQILRGILASKFVGIRKWNTHERDNVSNFFNSTKLPSEINRQMRNLKTVAFWKGTEWRSFLHYASIV
uniref:Transposase domain-containing protein n=1 Tax=Anopheles atroparvus TaxID=41427 RepID=A0AAG5D2N8_ANOAO